MRNGFAYKEESGLERFVYYSAFTAKCIYQNINEWYLYWADKKNYTIIESIRKFYQS